MCGRYASFREAQDLADAFALALKRTGRAVVRRTSIPQARDDR